MPTFADYEEIDIDWFNEISHEYETKCRKRHHAFRPDLAGEYVGECEICGITPAQCEPRYRHAHYTGVAWYVFSGCIACGNDCRIASMVGDDAVYHLDASDLTPIADEDYCSGCGQIGCGHGG